MRPVSISNSMFFVVVFKLLECLLLAIGYVAECKCTLASVVHNSQKGPKTKQLNEQCDANYLCEDF